MLVNKIKNQGFAWPVIAIALAIFAILLLVFILVFIPYMAYYIAGLVGGGTQPFGNSNFGMGNCAIVQTLDNIPIPDGGRGGISLEQHVVTQEEKFPGGWPTSQNDQIERHYQLTKFYTNCAGCPKQGFTPAEGGGNIGGGSTVRPPASAEPWIINMRWMLNNKKVNPNPGTKVLVTSVKTGRAVVAAAGYEWGPSATTGDIAGAQPEVFHSLGIEHGGEVQIGFAQDQSLSFGLIQCESGAGSTGPYTGRRTTYAGIEEALGKSCDESQLVTINFLERNQRVHKKAKAAFEAVDRDIRNSGIQYNFYDETNCKGVSWDGTYNCRSNVNNPSQMSSHSYGIAIDINPQCNPNVPRRGRPSCPTNIPLQVVQIFKSHGFRWGGDFRRMCDSMHFEWMNW